MKVKIIVFNSTCLLSPNSSKDRVLLNSWWTRTGTSTPERSPKIQPSTLLGDAGREPLLANVPVMPTSLCQIIPYPLAPNPTTTLLTMLFHRNAKTDYHIDRLGVGKTPSKKRVKRKTSNDQLFQICSKHSDYSSKVDYLFEIAKYFGHEIE